jgi:hypothetical protein
MVQELKKILNPLSASLGLYIYFCILIINTPTISPEIGLAYLYLSEIKNISDMLYKFVVFNGEWYRPFTFYLTNKIIFSIIDMRDIYQIKIIGLLIIGFMGWLSTLVAKKILDSNSTERAILFCLVISHPVYYMIAYDGSGITDPFFNIFILLFILFFQNIITDIKNKVNRYAFIVLSLLMIILSLLSQERGAAVFLVLVSFLVMLLADNNGIKVKNLKPQILLVCIGALVILILYVKFVYFAKQGWTGPDYRSKIEIEYILINLTRMFEFPSRLIFVPVNKIYDVHINIYFNITGLIILLISLIYLIGVFLGKFSYKKNIYLVLMFFLSASVIPVLFGGNAWHFYTASIFISMIHAKAINQVLTTSKFIKLKIPILIFMYSTLYYSIPLGIYQEIGGPSHVGGVMQLVYRAIHDKTIIDAGETMPELIYFDTGDYGNNLWAFGGKGNLFKYIYDNPNIIEIPVSKGKIIEGYENLCKKAVLKKSIYLVFNSSSLSWNYGAPVEYCKNE